MLASFVVRHDTATYCTGHQAVGAQTAAKGQHSVECFMRGRHDGGCLHTYGFWFEWHVALVYESVARTGGFSSLGVAERRDAGLWLTVAPPDWVMSAGGSRVVVVVSLCAACSAQVLPGGVKQGGPSVPLLTLLQSSGAGCLVLTAATGAGATTSTRGEGGGGGAQPVASKCPGR